MMAQTKQRLAVGLVLSLVLCTLPAHAEILGGNENSKPKNATSVIVIGAGLAGVAAARDLVDAGVSNVVLLEARPRAGGRLHSVNTTAGPVDVGGMWLHDATPDNPLYKLANETLGIPLSLVVQYNSGQLFGPDGKIINMAYYAATYISWVNQLQANITRLRGLEAAAAANGSSTNSTNSSAPAASLAGGAQQDLPFSQLFSDWVASNAARWQPQQLPVANALMTINVQNLLNGNVTRVSTLRYGDAKTLPAVDVHLKPGFDAVPLRLLPGLNVTYNTVVANISQGAANNSSSSVTVTTANGTQLTADYVIVTVPLGVLKQGTLAFDPPLPADKQAAIGDMGMGVLDKVVLVFKEEDVFWDNRVDFVILAPSDWSGRWTSWLSYYRLLGMPVLVGLNSADTALDIEALNDEDVVAEAMEALGKAFSNNGSKPLPSPIETHVTRWGTDPYARGAYSYFATGNPKNITDVLAAPHGRVLFAGEATSSKMATALGALLSGRREAQRIINSTMTSNGTIAA